MTELESAKLISISNLKTDIKPSLSFQKDIKKLTNIFKLIITSLSMFFIFVFTSFYIIIKSKSYVYQFLENRKVVKNLNYYIQLQNYFCDYFHSLYNKKLEEELLLYSISLENTNYDMFIYKSDDYISNIIQKEHFYAKNETLNILTALQEFANFNHIINPKEVVMIDIGGNIGWYPVYLGTYKYTILTFEPLPKNYYVLKKNFCRNNRDFFGDMSSIIIINEGLYSVEKTCDYYKNIEGKEKDIILCDTSKREKLGKDYSSKISVKMTLLSEILKYIDNRNIALIRINLDYEGEEAIGTVKHLFTQLHTPYIFIEFNIKSFEIRETDPKLFLNFFIENGYKISLNGFLDESTITIDEIISSKSEHISLYLTYKK